MDELNKYTFPRLVKGKKPIKIPKGSNLEKEWVKTIWYVNYTFNGKQYRIKGDINRIKDYREKSHQAEVLLQSIKDDLKNGYNPSNPEAFVAQMVNEDISLEDLVKIYLEDLKIHTRPKTVGSYKSKLHYLIEAFPKKLVKSFTSTDIEKYLYGKISSVKPAKLFLNGKSFELKKSMPWTANTVRSAKGIFHAFFQWCIEKKYYKGKNPVGGVGIKRIRSEVASKPRHTPFATEDISKVMSYLDEHDKPIAFFARFIYYSCLRPGEICKLKLKDIDLTRKRITVPLNVTKNTKKSTPDIIDIESSLFNEIEKLKVEKYPYDCFLTSKSDTIIGPVSMGSNTPYKRFIKALGVLGLLGKGYTLYSFKHYSNIIRVQNGWNLAEIMKVNRHSTVTNTEKYLKDLSRYTDISKKEVPSI